VSTYAIAFSPAHDDVVVAAARASLLVCANVRTGKMELIPLARTGISGLGLITGICFSLDGAHLFVGTSLAPSCLR